MYPILEDVSKKMVQYIKKQCTNGTVTLELNEMTSRYTLDTVAAYSMGLEGHCFSEKESVVRKLRNEILSLGTINAMKTYIAFTFPFVGTLLRFT